MKKKTVGQVATEEMHKDPGVKSVVEITNVVHDPEKYLKNLIECAETNRKIYPGDFYIEVQLKNEPLLWNVFKDQFYAKHACPTPTWDQTVYRYDHHKEAIEYLWTIPCQDACYYLYNNAALVNKSEQESLKFVLDFFDGTLFSLAKKLNGEQQDSPLLEG